MSDLMYTPLENVFADTMAREGKSITAVISGKTFTAFFRRCDDGQSTEDRIMLYYGVDAPVNQGSLIQYGKKTYVLVNKETEENTCYYKSFAIACNGILNTNNRTVKNVPVYGYDLKNGLTSVNNTISIVNGNMEFVTEITDTVKVLAIDDTFNIYGRIPILLNIGRMKIPEQTIMLFTIQRKWKFMRIAHWLTLNQTLQDFPFGTVLWINQNMINLVIRSLLILWESWIQSSHYYRSWTRQCLHYRYPLSV